MRAPALMAVLIAIALGLPARAADRPRVAFLGFSMINTSLEATKPEEPPAPKVDVVTGKALEKDKPPSPALLSDDELIKGLSDKDSEIRQSCAEELGRRGPRVRSVALAPLVEQLEDPDAKTRSVASAQMR